MSPFNENLDTVDSESVDMGPRLSDTRRVSLALAFYGVVVMAIFKLIPVTLTLTGLGGFILSVGMAVDANVLIFERMKEELRSGRTVGAAIEAGFNRAWTAIRDSNITTIIVCIILYWLGSSIAESALVKGSTCGKLSLNIEPDGGISPCGFMPIIIGNILKDDFDRMWFESPVLEKLRSKTPTGKCSGCDSYDDCLGGCPARSFALTGNFDSPDPHCWVGEEEPRR